jgi:tetratricopeptide (TPR) repeat protein
VFCRYLFDLRADLKLPVWFLVDEKNNAHKIYFTPPDPNDLNLLNNPDREKVALPHGGRFYTPPARNYSALGAAFFAAGFPDQALRYLLLAPQQDFKILFAIGQIHLEAGRWDPARKYYEQGLALSPDAADGWNNLGAVEMGAGNYKAALDRYQKALTLRPDMLSALTNAGEAYRALGDTDAAGKMFQRVLEIRPDDAAAANQMGELLVGQRRDNEAKGWFQRAISGRRDYVPAINNLGALYLRMGQPNDAIAAFQYGITIAPDEESLYLNLGSIYVGMGNAEAARQIVERLLARKPASVRARQAIRELETR